MFYAFRHNTHTKTLTEFKSAKEMAAEQARLDLLSAGHLVRTHLTRCTAEQARAWVKNDGHHETALWVDGGKVRRAGNGF